MVYALYKKELSVFFSSATGYVVLSAFLVGNAVMLWLIPEDNLFDTGYADLGKFFQMAPYIFTLFIPSLTMRMFADEIATGTMEILFTKPISELKIIISKYLAALSLVGFGLVLTLVYPISLWYLGSPRGNIDVGAVLGSYLGLLFLASIYVSAGIFASTVSSRQITANLIGVGLGAFVTFGLPALAELPLFMGIDLFIIELGVNSHYSSMSRGVLDSRDILYFLSATLFFLLASLTVLRKRTW
jgi:ABC-2 type transport system permease protein